MTYKSVGFPQLFGQFLLYSAVDHASFVHLSWTQTRAKSLDIKTTQLPSIAASERNILEKN